MDPHDGHGFISQQSGQQSRDPQVLHFIAAVTRRPSNIPCKIAVSGIPALSSRCFPHFEQIVSLI